MITLIAAVAKNNVIGKDNKLPWHLPEDLKHFKNTTDGHVILMGSNTWKSFNGRPLPNRKHVIVTSNPESVDCPDACVVTDLNCAISSAKIFMAERNQEQFFVIGGSSIYRQMLPIADRMIITRVREEFDGDTFFPEFGLDWLLEAGHGIETSKTGLTYNIEWYKKIGL